MFKLFDELKSHKVFKLCFFGGEPFLHPDILEILEKIRDYPFVLSILSNGTLINKEVVKALKQLKYLKTLQISLDGSSARLHDWQRGKGSFKKTLKGITLLKDNNIRYSLKAVINQYNFYDIENMVNLAKDLGLKGMAFGDAVESGQACLYRDKIRLTGEIYEAALIEIAKLKKEYPDFNFSGTLAQTLEFIEIFKKQGPGNGKRGKIGTCGAGYNTLTIRPDGWVIPCSPFWTYKLGNIRRKSLSYIWNNSSQLNKIRNLQDIPLSQFAECRDCQFITYCNGGCRAAGYYANNKDLKGLDTAKCAVFSTDILQRILGQI